MESARGSDSQGERRTVGKGVRRYNRFKASLKGCIEYSGSSYLCLVEDMNDRGFQLLSIAAPEVGEQMRFTLRVSQDAQLSCLIEVRHIASDGFLGARIVAIDAADASVLRRLIDEHSKCAA
jgi:hypothetical protein